MMKDTLEQEAALWQCAPCGLWWCSQPEVRPTDFMLQLPVETLEALGWENFRGWRLGGTPHVATCPDCSCVSAEPAFGSASPGGQLRLDLATLLTPTISSPAESDAWASRTASRLQSSTG